MVDVVSDVTSCGSAALETVVSQRVGSGVVDPGPDVASSTLGVCCKGAAVCIASGQVHKRVLVVVPKA